MKYCKEQEDVVTCLVGCLSCKFRHTQDRSFLKSIEGKTDFPSLDGKMFRLLDKGEFFFILVKPYKERIEELLVASLLRWSNSSPKVLQDPYGQGSSYIYSLLYPLCTS